MGNVLDNIKSKREQLADAAENTNIGVKTKKKAAPMVKETETIRETGKVTKYNTPRKSGESFNAYAERLEGLQKAQRGR